MSNPKHHAAGVEESESSAERRDDAHAPAQRGHPVEVIVRSRVTADAWDLARDYRSREIPRGAAYSTFVIDRALRPEMDAASFLALYDVATPEPFREIEIRGEITPSFLLTEAVPGAVAKRVTILERTGDAVRWVSDDAIVGSTPNQLIAELRPLGGTDAMSSGTSSGAGPGVAAGRAVTPEPDPRVGDVIAVTLPGGFRDEYTVLAVEDGVVALGPPGSTVWGIRVPLDVFPQFRDDLGATVRVSPMSGDPAVDAVALGQSVYLGKGDDGMVFRAGDEAVKVSTVVPYVPFNYRPDLTAESSVDRLAEQTELSEKMRIDGVPGILASRFVRHEGKGFAVRPYVEIPERLGPDELDRVQRQLLAMHERGYALIDQIQVGALNGALFFFDTGKAESLVGLSASARRDRLESDTSHLERLYRTNGAEYWPLGGYGLAEEWSRLANPLLNSRAELDPQARAAMLERAARASSARRDEIRTSELSAQERRLAEQQLGEQYDAVHRRFGMSDTDAALDERFGPPAAHEMSCSHYVAARLGSEAVSLAPRAASRRERDLAREWALSVLTAARRLPDSIAGQHVVSYETGRMRGDFPNEPLPERTLERLDAKDRKALADVKHDQDCVPPAPYTVEVHKSLSARLRQGHVTADELEACFEQLVESRESIEAQLSSRAIDELAPNGAGGRSKSEIVESIYHRMLCRFSLGAVKPEGPLLSTVARVRDLVATFEDIDVRAYANRQALVPAIVQASTVPDGVVDQSPVDPERARFVDLPASVRLSRHEFMRIAEEGRRLGGQYRRGLDGRRGFAFPDQEAAESFRMATAQTTSARGGPTESHPRNPTSQAAIPIPSADGERDSRLLAALSPSDRQLLDALANDAVRSQAATGVAHWTFAVKYPHPVLDRSDLLKLAARTGVDPDTARLAARVIASHGRAAGAGEACFLPRAVVSELRALAVRARECGDRGPELASIEAALGPSAQLEALGMTEARLPGFLAMYTRERLHERARSEACVLTEVPLGFLTTAAVHGTASDVRDGDIRVNARAGEPVIVAGLGRVEEAVACGRETATAFVADAAIPALRRFEETIAIERDRQALKTATPERLAI